MGWLEGGGDGVRIGKLHSNLGLGKKFIFF